jgi:hypothetical protein
MMTYLWVYAGSLDVEEKVLTLNTEGPNCMDGGKIAKYRDVIEVKSPDQRILTPHMLGDGGEWRPLMMVSYRRKT